MSAGETYNSLPSDLIAFPSRRFILTIRHHIISELIMQSNEFPERVENIVLDDEFDAL